MTVAALVGAVGLGAPIGWAATSASRALPSILTFALSLLLTPAVVALLISPAAAIASAGGVVAGAALRLLADFVITQRATTS